MQRVESVFTILGFSLLISAPLAASSMKPQGGTLTVPIITQTFVENFNPYVGGQVDLVSGTLFEPLWILNTRKGTTHWRLAETFQYDPSLESIAIRLRDGLTWSDGEVLDATDLAFSLNLGRVDPKLDITGLWGDGTFESVEVLDSLSVRIHFSEKDGTVDWYLPRLHVVPEHIWSKVDDYAAFRNLNPVGSGPITEVTQVRPNQVEICRNPYYYKKDQGLPYLDCIKFRQYTDNSQIQAALMKGEIDWGSNFIPDIEKTYVKANPANHGFWYPANDLIHLYLNTRSLPMSDVRFRQALSMSLDRPLIVDLAAYGYPTVEAQVTGIGAFFNAYQNPEVMSRYASLAEYNPEAASQLLDDAGFIDRDGDRFRDNPDGTPIDFEILVVNGWTDWVQTVQMITEYFAEIGIKSRIRTVDWSVYDAALKNGTYEAAINWSRTNGENPIQAYRDYFYTAQIGRSWHTNHGVQSPEIDALIDEYVAITDEARRTEILAALMEFTAQQLPFIPLFSNPTWYQYNRTRIDGWPSAENDFVQPVFYEGGTKLLVFEQLHLRQ